MTNTIYICKNCQEEFIPKYKQYSTFCSKSCSASYNNKNKKPRTKRSKEKTRNSMIIYYNKNKIIKSDNNSLVKQIFSENKFRENNKLSPRNKNNIEGPYTKLFLNKCSHCFSLFYSRTKIKYCLKHKELYLNKNIMNYKFNFNCYNYPDLFDIKMIEKIGWYYGDKKSKKYNPNGLSRDHRVSVNEAVRNNYDPYYIRHPLNCEIMLHNDNRKKSNKSSISYFKLVKLVDEYENRQ